RRRSGDERAGHRPRPSRARGALEGAGAPAPRAGHPHRADRADADDRRAEGTAHRAPRPSPGRDADRRPIPSGSDLVTTRLAAPGFPKAEGPAAEVVELLREVKDPEVPVVDVVGLGIVREVEVDGKNVIVKVTPTYSGCPATL